MLMKRTSSYLLFCLGLTVSMWVYAAPEFKDGTHYMTFKQPIQLSEALRAPANKVQVIEFFSYGCPWCYRLEPFIEKWLKSKSNHIAFRRVPVIFHPSWALYARAYHLVDALRMDVAVNQDLFTAVQNNKIKNKQALVDFFVQHGKQRPLIEKALESSPILDAKLAQDEELSRAFKIDRVPTVVIGQRYKANIGMVDGDNEKFIKLINFLVKKSRAKMTV